VRDLDVVAEDLVEPDLEGSDRGALPLARLERGDVLLPAVARVFELVQLAIVARADGVAVRRLRGWPLDQRAAELVPQIGQQIEMLGCLLERRSPPPRLEPVQRRAHVGQSPDRVAQRPQLAGRRATKRRTAREPLQVPYAAQLLPTPVAPSLAPH